MPALCNCPLLVFFLVLHVLFEYLLGSFISFRCRYQTRVCCYQYEADYHYQYEYEPFHNSVFTFPASSSDLAICLSAYPIATILLLRFGFGSSGNS